MFSYYRSFVNPSLHLTLCGDAVYLCKNIVSCHPVADKLLLEWLPRELRKLQKQRMKVIRDSFFVRRILLIESYSTVTQPKAVL